MKIGQCNRVKNEIIDKIMSNQDLLKLIKYTDSNVDIYSLPNLTSKEKRELINSHIYKHKRIPTSDSEEKKTYLSICYGKSTYQTRGGGGYFKDCLLGIYAITDKSLDNILQGSRIDEIEDIINYTFQCESVKGLTDCCIVEVNDLNLSEPYIGKCIILRFIDSNNKMFEDR